MSRPIEFRLVPTPGAKSEFLAVLEAKDPRAAAGTLRELPSTITLEGYTRDAWAADSATEWRSVGFQLASTAASAVNNNKLPGFVGYLRERKKAAFGRFVSKADGSTTVVVVPSRQASSRMANCRFAELSSIPHCPLRPIVRQQQQQQQQQQQLQRPPLTKQSAAAAQKATATGRKKGPGLLGNLVSAQKRTNKHLDHGRPSNRTAGAGNASAVVPGTATPDGTGQPNGQPGAPLKTAGQILAEFRQELEQKMLDFDIAPDPVVKIPLNLSAKLKEVVPEERDNGRITMEILKYLVYEAAEEINEEWIAYKEPSEFMDEVTVAVYKEGEAPPEVLEDINKAELPDEIRGQQKAMAQQQQRQEQQRASKDTALKQKEALRQAEEDDFAALNQSKRDRRTIEEIQRDNKRQRM